MGAGSKGLPIAVPGAHRKRIVTFLAACFTAMSVAAAEGTPEALFGDADLYWEDFRVVHDKPVEEMVVPPFRKRFGQGREQQLWARSPRIGNGHIGARVGGSVGGEHIFFNIIDFWSGKPYNDPRPDCKEHLAGIRQLLKEHKWAEAQDMAYEYFIAKEGVMKPSLAPGYIDLNLGHGEEYSAYQRVLDLDKAEVTVRYTVDGVRYDFHAICSYPDRAIAYRISASKPGALNLDVGLVGLAPNEIRLEGRDIVMASASGVVKVDKEGNVTRERGRHLRRKLIGMRANSRLRVVADGGEAKIENNRYVVSNANSAILYLTAASSFNGAFEDPETEGKDEVAIAKRDMAGATSISWSELLERHRADHQSLFRRFYVELGARHKPGAGAHQKGYEEGLPHALMTQMCRYVMIAGCREDSPTPLTLHGMWSSMNPALWNNAYHLNENLEKNHRFAEALGLPECQEPVFKLLKALSRQGAEIARENYGLDGWCAHHQTDIWAAAGIRPQRPKYGTWPFGGAFLAQYLWHHYRYSLDKGFLREYFPIIKGRAVFCLGWLSEGRDGWLVSAPSTSPENTFSVPGVEGTFEVAYATTCDMSLIRASLKECLWAAEELGVESDLCKRIKDTLPKLYPYPIGKEGQLLEWPIDTLPVHDKHRHGSGLLGMWLGSEITMQHTPKLWEAARKAVEFKGWKNTYPGTGVVWARARDGERALSILYHQDEPSYWMPQIYANAVAEMVLQSHAGEIDVLPALPKAWSVGRVYGIRAEGGFRASFSWKGGEVASLRLYSDHGKPVQVRCKGITTKVLSKGETDITAERVATDVIKLDTEKSKLYRFQFQ